MFKLVLVSTLLAVAYGLQLFNPRLDDRIIGGEATTIEKYPYQISLQYDGYHICGASIISNQFIITAAQCTYNLTADVLSIRAGSTYTGSDDVVIQVANIHQHDFYWYGNNDYDIAILELSKPLSFGHSIAAIDLPIKDEEINVGEDAVCTGWGGMQENDVEKNALQSLTVQIISWPECFISYGYGLTYRMMCAEAYNGGKGPCEGDTGNPLVSGGKLIGIVSFRNECASSYSPDVCTNVAILRDYITEIAGI